MVDRTVRSMETAYGRGGENATRARWRGSTWPRKSRPTAILCRQTSTVARGAPGRRCRNRGEAGEIGLISRKLLVGVAAAALLATAGWYGGHWWTVGRFMVSTDDAYVRAQNTTLAAKTAGYVSSILVADNAAVQAGQVIARIDDGDFRLARRRRQRKGSQPGSDDRADRPAGRSAQAMVAQARAQLRSAPGRRREGAVRTRPPAGARRQGLSPASRRSKRR